MGVRSFSLRKSRSIYYLAIYASFIYCTVVMMGACWPTKGLSPNAQIVASAPPSTAGECAVAFYSSYDQGYSNRAMAMDFSVAVAKSLNCSVVEPFEDGVDTGPFKDKALQIWNLSSVVPVLPSEAYVGEQKTEADVCVIEGRSRCGQHTDGPFRCKVYKAFPDWGRSYGPFLRVVQDLKPLLSYDGPTLIVLTCAFYMSFMHISPPVPLIDAVISKAEHFILENLGGKMNYISAHVRRADFNATCSHTAETWAPCSLNMQALPARLAQTATEHHVDTVFIASDGDALELTTAKHEVVRLMRDAGAAARVVVSPLDYLTSADVYEEIAIEQLILSCGRAFLGTPRSTFSLRALKQSVTLGCSLKKMLSLPVQ